MTWWFLILGVSTLAVVCVAIALYIRLRRHLRAGHTVQKPDTGEIERQSRSIEL
jgi:putative exporter of polyketide antibiotics